MAVSNAALIGFLVVLCWSRQASAITFPDNNASRDELITYYYNLFYTGKEICGFLLYMHNITVTLRQPKRIKRKLCLRRTMSSPAVVVRHIEKLYREGFENYGYKFVWRMLNTFYNIRASQQTVRLALRVIDSDGVLLRSRNRLRRRVYFNKGPNFLIHIDGYDKLKPYGFAIHGAIDGFSRKILWLKAGPSNNDPKLIANNFLKFVKQIKRVPRCCRSDCGTENVFVRDLQVVLRAFHTDSFAGCNSFITGKSSANQRIERFWGSLRNPFTQFWRNFFKDLIEAGTYQFNDPIYVEAARFCFLPVIQSHLDRFALLWNSHRIRKQTQGDTPSDIPDVLYHQPSVFGTVDYSLELPCSIDTLNTLLAEYSIEYPEFGCSDTFVELIQRISVLEGTDFCLKRSVGEALTLFKYITSRIRDICPVLGYKNHTIYDVLDYIQID